MVEHGSDYHYADLVRDGEKSAELAPWVSSPANRGCVEVMDHAGPGRLCRLRR